MTVAQTPVALPLPPINTRVTGVTGTTVTLAWTDQADNEIGFFIERQDVLPGQPLGPWVIIAYKGSQTPQAQFGGNTWTDGAALPLCPADVVAPPPASPAATPLTGRRCCRDGRTLQGERVQCGRPVRTGPAGFGNDCRTAPAPTGLTATAVNAFQVNLSWTDNTNNELTFRIQRATNAAFTANVTPFSVGANITTFSDTTVAPATTYFYRVLAHGQLQDSPCRPRPR